MFSQRLQFITFKYANDSLDKHKIFKSLIFLLQKRQKYKNLILRSTLWNMRF